MAKKTASPAGDSEPVLQLDDSFVLEDRIEAPEDRLVRRLYEYQIVLAGVCGRKLDREDDAVVIAEKVKKLLSGKLPTNNGEYTDEITSKFTFNALLDAYKANRESNATNRVHLFTLLASIRDVMKADQSDDEKLRIDYIFRQVSSLLKERETSEFKDVESACKVVWPTAAKMCINAFAQNAPIITSQGDPTLFASEQGMSKKLVLAMREACLPLLKELWNLYKSA